MTNALAMLPDWFGYAELLSLCNYHGVGAATRRKLEEIFDSGSLRRADMLAGSSRSLALIELRTVFGVGKEKVNGA